MHANHAEHTTHGNPAAIGCTVAFAAWLGGIVLLGAIAAIFGRTIATDVALAVWFVCVPTSLFVGETASMFPRGTPRLAAKAGCVLATVLLGLAVAWAVLMATLMANMEPAY